MTGGQGHRGGGKPGRRDRPLVAPIAKSTPISRLIQDPRVGYGA